jgi:hypothetical protein
MMRAQQKNYLSRRNSLGLFTDMCTGASKGAKYGLFGTLLLSASGVALGAGSLPALVSAAAIGGAIAILPAIILRDNLEFASNNSNFFLKLTSNAVFSTGFAFAAGYIGAAIMGLAATPAALTALSGALAFVFINVLAHTLRTLGELHQGIAENRMDIYASQAF